MKELFKADFPITNTIFTSVKEYVDANTFVSDLDFDKTSVFFYLYVTLTSLFTLVKLLSRLTIIACRLHRKLALKTVIIKKFKF